MEITELPIRRWTQDYKEQVLEVLLHGSEKVEPFIRYRREGREGGRQPTIQQRTVTVWFNSSGNYLYYRCLPNEDNVQSTSDIRHLTNHDT